MISALLILILIIIVCLNTYRYLFVLTVHCRLAATFHVLSAASTCIRWWHTDIWFLSSVWSQCSSATSVHLCWRRIAVDDIQQAAAQFRKNGHSVVCVLRNPFPGCRFPGTRDSRTSSFPISWEWQWLDYRGNREQRTTVAGPGERHNATDNSPFI